MPSIVTAINGITFIACNELAGSKIWIRNSPLWGSEETCVENPAHNLYYALVKVVDGIAYDDAQLLVAIQKFENKSSL